jgi:hypothetical protein
MFFYSLLTFFPDNCSRKQYQKTYKETNNSGGYYLYQNFPNPFNPSSVISFYIPQKSWIEIKVYNIFGELVQTVINEVREIGHHQVKINASNLASGVYLYSLKAGDFTLAKKLVVLK